MTILKMCFVSYGTLEYQKLMNKKNNSRLFFAWYFHHTNGGFTSFLNIWWYKDKFGFTKDRLTSSIEVTILHKESSRSSVKGKIFFTHLGSKSFKAFIKRGMNIYWSYFSTIVVVHSLPTCSMTHWNLLKLRSSWRTHMLCVAITLKHITNFGKWFNIMMTLRTILKYKISNLGSSFPHVKGGVNYLNLIFFMMCPQIPQGTQRWVLEWNRERIIELGHIP